MREEAGERGEEREREKENRRELQEVTSPMTVKQEPKAKKRCCATVRMF